MLVHVRGGGPGSRAGCLHAGGAFLRAGPTLAGLEVRPLSPCDPSARTLQSARAGELSVRSIHPYGHVDRSADARPPKKPVPDNPMRSITPHPSFIPRIMRPHSLDGPCGNCPCTLKRRSQQVTPPKHSHIGTLWQVRKHIHGMHTRGRLGVLQPHRMQPTSGAYFLSYQALATTSCISMTRKGVGAYKSCGRSR